MRTLLVCLGLAAAGCHSAGMDDMAFETVAAPAATPDSPYEIELIDGSGTPLPTFAHDGRFYVLGQVGQRYSIRVRNPTPHRVEAVISVDGLDVIDGETAAVTKRGYLVAPYADIKIDGFRVSNHQVAAFRFSSVANSYAGRKGVARNVGVIGVALFAERVEQPLVLPEPTIGAAGGDYRGRDLDDSAEVEANGRAADRPGSGAPARARRIRPPSPRPEHDGVAPKDPFCCRQTNQRPGLGTEFGERRHSSVRFTRFVRANPTRPSAYAELRYNDRSGLAALGILASPTVPDDELTRRETAEPFPGYAKPPR